MWLEGFVTGQVFFKSNSSGVALAFVHKVGIPHLDGPEMLLWSLVRASERSPFGSRALPLGHLNQAGVLMFFIGSLGILLASELLMHICIIKRLYLH